MPETDVLPELKKGRGAPRPRPNQSRDTAGNVARNALEGEGGEEDATYSAGGEEGSSRVFAAFRCSMAGGQE